MTLMEKQIDRETSIRDEAETERKTQAQTPSPRSADWLLIMRDTCSKFTRCKIIRDRNNQNILALGICLAKSSRGPARRMLKLAKPACYVCPQPDDTHGGSPLIERPASATKPRSSAKRQARLFKNYATSCGQISTSLCDAGKWFGGRHW